MTTTVDQARARALCSVFDRRRVLIVGDVMLDHFLVGRVNRISPEAPVPVVEFVSEQMRLGGAANVAANVRALGAAVDLVGVVGTDGHADVCRSAVAAQSMAPDGLVTASDRPTTRKMRVVTTRNQQVARVDYEVDADVAGDAQQALAARAVRAVASADVVVVSDYLKGVVTAGLMDALREAASRRGVPLLVDPKIPHLALYRGASLITPNHHEAEQATAMRIRSEADASEAAREFRRRAGCTSVLITRGEHGMYLLEGRGDGEGVVSERSLPARAREVADVTGAGDTVIATMALALAAGASLAESAELATYAASVSVQKFGPGTVSVGELLGAMD